MVGLGPRKPPSRKGEFKFLLRLLQLSVKMSLTQEDKGSMADVPKDLLEQIKNLERQFTVDQAKLKEVTNHFVKELEKGWLIEGPAIYDQD